MRILFVNMLVNNVGDSLQYSILFRIIKKNFPGADLTVACSKPVSALYKNNPYIDNILELEHLHKISEGGWFKYFRYLQSYFKLVKETRNQYDLMYVSVPIYWPMKFLPFFIRPQESTGFNLDIPYNDRRGTKDHNIECALDLVRDLKYDEKDKRVRMYFSDKELVKTDEKYICVCPTANWPNKEWRIDYFINVIKKLPYKVYLFGREDEKHILDYIMFNCKIQNKQDIEIVEPSLRKMALFMKNAQFTICNNSGPAHISSAVGTTTFMLSTASPTHHATPQGIGKVIQLQNPTACDMICNTNMPRQQCPYDWACTIGIGPADLLKAIKKEGYEVLNGSKNLDGLQEINA